MEKSLFEVAGWSEEDCILSLGCGAAWWEIKQIVEQEAGELLLLDLNKEVLNWSDVEEAIRYFEKQAKNRALTPINLLHADASSIPLASATVDQIWLLNSLHEMEDPASVMPEIDRLLTLPGTVIVEEILTGEVHAGCGNRLFTIDELVDLFRLIDMQMDYRCSKDREADYIKFVR